MASSTTTEFVPITVSGGISSSPSTIDSASFSQATRSTTQFTGPPRGGGYGPPPWVETAIEQYQASQRSSRENAQNATSSPTTLMTTTIDTASITAPSAAAATAPSTSSPSGNDRVKIGVSIAFGVSFLWLISAFVIWWILRKRRAKRGKEMPSAVESTSSYSITHPCACQCHEVEGDPGIKREELHNSHRAEMKGDPGRTELPA
ncbi:MAG: hypothetical protein Q9198_005914 [Flavoplaca austrocitrina]